METTLMTFLRQIFVVILSILSLAAQAADLNASQLAVLKQAIIDEPELAAARAARSTQQITTYLNQDSTFVVWKTAVPIDEIMRNGMDWGRVDNLTVGKARIWEWISRLGSIDCSRSNIRVAIDETWKGTAADLAVRDVVYTHCKRTSSNFQKIFATGTGTSVSPGVIVVDGVVDELTIRRLAWSDTGTWLLP